MITPGKIAIVFVLGLVTTQMASASLILYSQDFSSDPTVADSNGFIPLGATGGEYDYQTWVQFGSTYNGGAENLMLSTRADNGATRGAGFALDGTGLLAGDYSLRFEVVSTNHAEGIGLGIYGMNFGGTAAYEIDPRFAAGNYIQTKNTDPSNVRKTLSANQMITGTGIKTINFTVAPGNAGDDLIFLFSARTGSGNAGSFTTTIDNVVVTTTAIPEPLHLHLASRWTRRHGNLPLASNDALMDKNLRASTEIK